MAATTQPEPLAPAARRLEILRGNCMAAAVLLIIQFAVGTAVNLYVSISKGKSFFPAIFGSALLATHVIIALVLLAAAISALVRAIRSRTAVTLTAAGLAAILVAASAGSSFVGDGANGSSLGMALAAAVALLCYAAAVFRLR
jgi:hypothetical protein